MYLFLEFLYFICVIVLIGYGGEKEKLEAKEALDLEVEHPKKMYMEIQEKMGAIAKKLKEKEDELDNLEEMNQTRIIMEPKLTMNCRRLRKS